MKIKFIKIQIAVIILLTIFAGVNFTSAADLIKPSVETKIGDNAKLVGGAGGYEEGDEDSALILIQTIISIFLSIIGVLLLAYILYAGYNWLTAQGDEEKVTRAKDTIKRAIVGVIIIIGAYAISTFVMSRIESGVLQNDKSNPVGNINDGTD